MGRVCHQGRDAKQSPLSCSRVSPARPVVTSNPCVSVVLLDLGPIRLGVFAPNGRTRPLRSQRLLDLLVTQFPRAGHFTPAAWSADKYSWALFRARAQLRAV